MNLCPPPRLALLLCLACSALAPAAPRPLLAGITGQLERVPLYGLLELTVDLQARIRDPYDPDEVALSALFSGPSGQELVVEGFLYAGEVTLTGPVQDAVWKLRFTPVEVGKWTYRVRVKTRAGEAEQGPFPFECTRSTHDGFVRVDPAHPTYFALDSGKFYYPLGQNVSWLKSGAYDAYFTRMAENQENWARIWMSNWSFGIEWRRTGGYKGFGNYNLDNARKLDELLFLAERHGIYLQLVFDFHGAYSTRVNPEWQNNPHNRKNGGLLSSPEQFFTHPGARSLYKKRLRYIVARYGWSPRIMAWEFFNEVSFTDNYDDRAVTAWHREMAAEIRGRDPWKHLRTSSFAGTTRIGAYEDTALDFTQLHIYDAKLYRMLPLLVPHFKRYGKPFFVGEFGSNTADGGDDLDRRGVFLHAGIWLTFMQDISGNAMPWWWDTHIHPNNLYPHFGALARFGAGLDRRAERFTPHRERLRMRSGGEQGRDYFFALTGLRGEGVSVYWLCDEDGMLPANGRSEGRSYDGVRLRLPVGRDGPYRVEHWDTYRGAILRTDLQVSKLGTLEIELPLFTNDIALKIRSN